MRTEKVDGIVRGKLHTNFSGAWKKPAAPESIRNTEEEIVVRQGMNYLFQGHYVRGRPGIAKNGNN